MPSPAPLGPLGAAAGMDPSAKRREALPLTSPYRKGNAVVVKAAPRKQAGAHASALSSSPSISLPEQAAAVAFPKLVAATGGAPPTLKPWLRAKDTHHHGRNHGGAGDGRDPSVSSVPELGCVVRASFAF